MSDNFDNHVMRYRLGLIDRRGFIKGALALGLAAPAALNVISGAEAATPGKGGRLRMGVGAGSTADTLDPANADNSFTQVLALTRLSTLTEVMPDGSLGPQVAKSWEASADARTWLFDIERGVTFHNGKDLTLDDIIASINHHRGEESKSAAKVIVDEIDGLKADGGKLVVTLKTGNADFPYLLSDQHIAMLPSRDGKVDALSGVGTGPFILESFDAGVRAVVRRNPDYFRDGLPHFDSVEMLAIADVVARTTALKTGEIDIMDRCDLKTVHLLKRDPNLVVSAVEGMQHYTIPMNTTVAPFDDNDVRLALKYAIDREQLLKTVLLGYGSVGNDNPVSPNNRYYLELPRRAYDPEKARFHLKKAGLNSLKVDLSASDAAFSGCVDTAILYKEHAAKAGIDINVVREPADGYWSNVWMKKPWSFSYWGGRPVEDQLFTTGYKAGAPWNESFWANDRFNELLLAAKAELDTGKRRGMYGEMQELVHHQGGTVIPLFASYVGAHSKKLGHGPEIAGNFDFDGFRVAERWWFNE